ncbi:GNAT family N-acetyltransferase [Rhizobium sp. LjRoot254]|uniref:GNAT family N-acetyltransferase n=1 Tax=Rhizobium sp. LjRoot254 TaxID=3342297 RepID=UPI003ECE71D0
MLAPLIKTERLLLRPYRLEDFPHLSALYETDRAAFIGGRLPRRRVWDGFMNCVGQWAIFGFGGWAVEETASGATVGEVAIQRPPDYPETELGWLVFEGFEGKGYAFEAAAAAKRWAFSEMGLPSLVSYIDPDNARSIRLAERLGAALDPAAPTPNGDPCHVFRHNHT